MKSSASESGLTFVGFTNRDRGRERTKFLRFLQVSDIRFSLEISGICLANWLQSSFEIRNFLQCGHEENIVRRSGLAGQLAFIKKSM